MTAQAHEKLILNGQEYSMAFCPSLPIDSPFIFEVSQEEVMRQIKAKEIDDIIFSTACWRNYLGTWEIKDGKLYLNYVTGKYRKTSNEPIFAEWFTGVLRIPKGELLLGVHMGFGSIFEKEIHIKVENGLVKKQREIENSPKVKELTDLRKKLDTRHVLAMKNLPGNENSFEGDDW